MQNKHQRGVSKEHELALDLAIALIILVTLLVAGFGCGVQPDYTTRHGIDVLEEGATADLAEIEQITEAALALWPTRLEGLTLRLRAEPIQYPGIECTFKGSFAEGTLTVWVGQDPCLARTTLGHELLHAIVWLETRDADRHHELVGPLDRELRQVTIPEMCGGNT